MKKPLGRLEALAAELKNLSNSIADEQPTELSPNQARRVRKTIEEAYEKLLKVIEKMDPAKQPGFMFGPSNPNVVGRVVAITMVAQIRKPLTAMELSYAELTISELMRSCDLWGEGLEEACWPVLRWA